MPIFSLHRRLKRSYRQLRFESLATRTLLAAHTGPDGPTCEAIEAILAGLSGQAAAVQSSIYSLDPSAPGYQAALNNLTTMLDSIYASIAMNSDRLAELDCDGTGPSGSGPSDSGPTNTGPTSTGPTSTGPTSTGPTSTGPTNTGPTSTGPTSTGPTSTGPTSTGPTSTGPTSTGPTSTGPTSTGPTSTGPTSTDPTDTDPSGMGPTLPGPVPSGPTSSGPAVPPDTPTGSGPSAPIAHADTYAALWNRSLQMDVTANDWYFPSNGSIKLLGQPIYGNAKLIGNKILYEPDPTLSDDLKGIQGCHIDSIAYKIETPAGTSSAMVSINIEFPISTESRHVSVHVQSTDYADYSEYRLGTGSVLDKAKLDPGFQAAIAQRQAAITQANNDWDSNEQQKYELLVSSVEQELSSLESDLRILETELDDAYSENEATFVGDYTSLQDSSREELQSNTHEYNSAIAGLIPLKISDGSGESTGASGFTNVTNEQRQQYVDSLNNRTAALSRKLSLAAENHNSALQTADNAWENGFAQSGSAYSQAALDNMGDYFEDLETAIGEYESKAIDDLQEFVDSLNPLVQSRDSGIKEAKTSYLAAIQTAKAGIASEVRSYVTNYLNALQPYYQAVANYKAAVARASLPGQASSPNTIAASETTMRNAVKTAVLSILAVRKSAESAVGRTLRSFAVSEQGAMKQMASKIAQIENNSFVAYVQKIKDLSDEVVDASKTFANEDVRNAAKLETSNLTERKEFANTFTGHDTAYRLDLYRAGNSFDKAKVEASSAVMAGKLADFQSLASQLSGTTTTGDLADTIAYLNAVASLRTDDLDVYRDHMQSASTLEVTKIRADNEAEWNYGDGVVAAIKESSQAIYGKVAAYQKAVNQLDQTWFTSATSKDASVVTALGSAIKTENLRRVDEYSAGHGDAAFLAADALLRSVPIDQWPLTLGLPTGSHGLTATQARFANAVIPVLDVVTESLESFFSAETPAPEELRLRIEEDTSPTPETTFIREGTVTKPANVPRAVTYAEGDEIKDAQGHLVGTVVVINPGQLRVKREDVEVYVPEGNQGGINPGSWHQWFAFYLPLGTVVQNLDGAGNWIDADTYWDSVFRQGDSPQYDQEVGGTPPRPVPQPRDITPQWLDDVLFESNVDIGRTFDAGLDHVDAFFAGFASTVSGGVSDRIRSGIYGGYIDVNQSDSSLYTVGQITGIVPAVATGILSGGTTTTLGTAGHVARAAKVITTVDIAHSYYNAGSKLATGERLQLGDYLAFRVPAGAHGQAIVSKFGKGFVAPKAGDYSMKAVRERWWGGKAPVRPNADMPRGREYMELSHTYISNNGAIGKHIRDSIKNRGWNLKSMWGSEHAMVDPHRYQFMKRSWRDANEMHSPIMRMVGRMPTSHQVGAGVLIVGGFGYGVYEYLDGDK